MTLTCLCNSQITKIAATQRAYLFDCLKRSLAAAGKTLYKTITDESRLSLTDWLEKINSIPIPYTP